VELFVFSYFFFLYFYIYVVLKSPFKSLLKLNFKGYDLYLRIFFFKVHARKCKYFLFFNIGFFFFNSNLA
jgi:hypothetical protein